MSFCLMTAGMILLHAEVWPKLHHYYIPFANRNGQIDSWPSALGNDKLANGGSFRVKRSNLVISF